MILAFLDLDDTVFQTLRKLPGVNRSQLTAATLNSAGEPHSFCTPKQSELLKLLQMATIIPVTGRDMVAMNRVLLPFHSWKVIDHGLTIITPEGHLDQAWAEQVSTHLTPLQHELEEATQYIEPLAKARNCRIQHHQAHGLPFMTVIKHNEAKLEPLVELKALWQEHMSEHTALHFISNSNQVSLLPKAIGKRQAVEYLLEHYFQQATLSLGLGDSVSDLAFMSACDFAITPQKGQILKALNAVDLPHC